MAAGPRERIGALITDVEKTLKQVRADFRKRTDLEKALKQLRGDIHNLGQSARKGAADIAGQVEKYVHDLRVGLEGKPAARKRTARRKPARRKRA